MGEVGIDAICYMCVFYDVRITEEFYNDRMTSYAKDDDFQFKMIGYFNRGYERKTDIRETS